MNLSNGEILLTEKKFEVNGEKKLYFSELFLECHAPMSPKTKLDIVTKAVEQVNKKYYGDEDTRRKMEVKQAIYDELEEKGSLEVEAVKEKVFKDSPQMQADLEEKLEKYNMEKEIRQAQERGDDQKVPEAASDDGHWHRNHDSDGRIEGPREGRIYHKSRRDDFRADQKYRAFEHQIKNALISTFQRGSFYAFVPKKDHNKACSGLEKRFKSSMIKKKGENGGIIVMARKVVLAGACRTAIGVMGGTLSKTPAPDLGTVVIKEALKRTGIKPEQVDEVYMGCVIQAGLGQNPARQAAVNAGIPVEVPATTINVLCGSGMHCVNLAAKLIASGDADIIVAGGMENMSMAPYLLYNARFGYRMGAGKMDDALIRDALTDAFGGYHMGITAENIAEDWGADQRAAG